MPKVSDVGVGGGLYIFLNSKKNICTFWQIWGGVTLNLRFQKVYLYFLVDFGVVLKYFIGSFFMNFTVFIQYFSPLQYSIDR